MVRLASRPVTAARVAGARAAVGAGGAADEIRLASRDLGSGLYQNDLSVPGMRCAGCMSSVEKALSALPGVEFARVNLSMKRVTVRWRAEPPPDLIGALGAAGFDAHLFAPEPATGDPRLGRLLRALAVAGFASMNIMLLSVSVWAGAGEGARQAFHLISAVLALPVLLYSGQVFYVSAWSALKRGRTNMDVPISIGVALAFALSIYDTLNGAPRAYFEAATSLVFFLLIGRTLDHVMRERARSAVAGLARMAPAGGTVIGPDGRRRFVPVAEIAPGSKILVAAGDRIPIDGVVLEGASDLDCSLVSGESAPRRAGPGLQVQAGIMNLTGPLTIRTTASAQSSFLSEMVRMMEAAEGGRARYRRIADRAASLYAPVVHSIALLSFVGWMIATGDWHLATTIAVSVLIITCPCALGLAVPIVQVVAARRLFEAGIMAKDGSALERLAEVDAVLFDKTGTLTVGRPRLVNGHDIPDPLLAIAAALAAGSRHPLAAALAYAGEDVVPPLSRLKGLTEHPGCGMEGRLGADIYRLGRPGWALEDEVTGLLDDAAPVSVLSRNGRLLALFQFEDRQRSDAWSAVERLTARGLRLEILSGDRKQPVDVLAGQVGIDAALSDLLPAGKVARIAALGAEGCKVLMVGDGLNDAPALAAAHVSMAPATAADIGRVAADFVFLNESLTAVPDALDVSIRSGVLIRQNFAFAVVYNVIAVPVALSGAVTPLIAAIAMSLSSLVVVANAMRLSGPRRPGPSLQPTRTFHVRQTARAAS
ncbi:MAG: cadmium-translocating P-type ATPase [Brevundimonas sp.]|nr:MAG: cadmium-translocating P-type ATPase [Brevundimonas sp.]